MARVKTIQLEGEPQRELDLADRVVLQAGDQPEVLIVQIAVGVAKLRRVEDVERLSTERGVHSFGDGEILLHGEVHGLVSRPMQKPTP